MCASAAGMCRGRTDNRTDRFQYHLSPGRSRAASHQPFREIHCEAILQWLLPEGLPALSSNNTDTADGLQVTIDDYLPASKTGRALFAACRNDPSVFGAALIEKAYLKIMGGYDFPGSNSGTDLLVLTGWIPEHIFLQSDEMIPSVLWRRMTNAWAIGDVLITLGTGPMTSREETELGLIGEHDYAVLDLKDSDGERMLLVKNPWSEGTVWKGAPLADDDDDEDRDFDDPPPPRQPLSMSSLAAALDPPLPPGVFWISLDNVCRNFSSIYLNWNPSLFTHMHETHFTWDLSTKTSETLFSRNPQFSLSAPPDSGPVWILLSRHLGLPHTVHEGMHHLRDVDAVLR